MVGGAAALLLRRAAAAVAAEGKKNIARNDENILPVNVLLCGFQQVLVDTQALRYYT